MKVLFFMRSTIYVRNFESTLRLLAARGHDVHIVADTHYLTDTTNLVARLREEHPNIRHSPSPVIPFNPWTFFGHELRRMLDYLRYLGPEFADAPKLRERAAKTVPPIILDKLPGPIVNTARGRKLAAAILRWCDRSLFRDPHIDTFIRQEAPDLVLVTPLVEPGSPQADYLRSARSLGIRTVLCVYSWDNLTNKGLIHDPLDLVTVWNEPMKREATTLHRVDPDRILVTGAAAYDHWFTWKPRWSREEFCRRVGLDPSRPYLLYVCSSKFIAPDEIPFIRRWVTELRGLSPTLREASVLVRPHPQWAFAWEKADLSDLGRVAVWPRPGTGGLPVDVDSRSEYFDSIHHSAAVIGVNTSAQIESAVAGRGVYTVLAPEFRDTQEGTLHFQHLRNVNGGLLHVAETFEEHAVHLERAVLDPAADAERCRRFIEGFVRPHGLEVAATPRLVDALEAVAARGPARPDVGPWYSPLLRPLLGRPSIAVANTGRARRIRVRRRERIKHRDKVARTTQRLSHREAKQQANAEKARQKQQEEMRRAEQRRADEAVAARAYETYLEVRERVGRMRVAPQVAAAVASRRDDRSGGPSGPRPSGAWNAGEPVAEGVVLTERERTTIGALAHLWHATPETIAALRRWCEPITGVSPADYQIRQSALEIQLRRDQRRLVRRCGGELFVTEPSALGGFGLTGREGRFNEDTLKYFCALVALEDGGVLGGFGTDTRRLVWEIGGGWGGFAYRFKTARPNVTYLVTGAPELLLVSAVYLKTVMPDASLRFHDEAMAPADLWKDWEGVDFIFAPETALATLQPPRLDLTVDLMALRDMTDDRVRCHVRRAYDAGCRFLYSMLPAASATDRPSAWTAIGERYWPHRVPPRLDFEPVVGGVEGGPPPRDLDYAHLIGWKRLRT